MLFNFYSTSIFFDFLMQQNALKVRSSISAQYAYDYFFSFAGGSLDFSTLKSVLLEEREEEWKKNRSQIESSCSLLLPRSRFGNGQWKENSTFTKENKMESTRLPIRTGPAARYEKSFLPFICLTFKCFYLKIYEGVWRIWLLASVFSLFSIPSLFHHDCRIAFPSILLQKCRQRISKMDVEAR